MAESKNITNDFTDRFYKFTEMKTHLNYKK